MRRAFLSLPLLVAFALLEGCGGGDAESSSGAGAGGAAGLPGGAAGKGGTAGAVGGAGSGGDAGTSAGGASGAGSSGAAGVGGTTSCGGSWAAIPGVPKDWVPFSTPDCGCTFYTPPPGGAAAPFEWEPCAPDNLQGVACKRLKTSGPGEAFSVHGARWSAAPPALQLLRGYPTGPEPTRVELALGDLDAAGAWAVAGPYKPSCRPLPESTFDGRYVLGTSNDDAHTHGVVTGAIGQSPDVMRSGLSAVNDTISSWGSSSMWLFRSVPGAITASLLGGADSIPVYAPSMDLDSLPGFLHYLHGPDAIIDVSAGGHAGFVSWSASAGLRSLLRTPHDSSRGFLHLGSDGKDLAFTYAEGATSQYVYARRVLFTAPYTIDPDTLKATAKPLTAVPRISAPKRWAVGCGLAAVGAVDLDLGVSLLVVRLSDGAFWRKWPKDPLTYGGIEALGVTCTELILTGKQGLPTRVRLDSLGDPMPPLAPDIQQYPF